MSKSRYYIVIGLLLVTAALAYGLPKVKYESPDVLSLLSVPEKTPAWRSTDVSGTLDMRDMRYNFISRVFARNYVNRYGESLLFLILDAGNFHHPKVCFTGSGHTVREVDDVVLTVGGRKVRAKCLFTEKSGTGTLLMYWICINKQNVDWTGQKLVQLWYSMFNKQKIGYMVRLEIPTYSIERVPKSVKLAQEFLDSIAQNLPQEQREYIFGK